MRTFCKQSASLLLRLALPALFLLTGCKTIQVHLGLKVDLAKAPVTAIEAKMAGDPGIAPGEQNGLIVSFSESNGKVLVTQGAGKGKALWTDLQVTPTLVTFKKGVIRLPADPRKSQDKTAHLTITVPSHPGLKAELDVPVRYDYAFLANFSGANGANGANGTDGATGRTGSSGSTDPNNPSPGEDGGAGGDGTDGGNGGNGGDAPPVTVALTLRAGAHPLLQARVSAPGAKTRYFLIDPAGGSLTASASGGAGGSGGSGGSAGQGGSGGSGTPPGSNGLSGRSGSSGFSGVNGNAGSITVTYDPSVAQYLPLLHLVNQGGPKPQLTQAPVAPLW